MNQILIKILDNTKQEILFKKSNKQKFFNAIDKSQGTAIIAEIKLASPTEGKLGFESEILRRVKEYEKSKVNAVSVITEKSVFKGSPGLVAKIKRSTNLPILQKDFILDELQIYEAKLAGSDALLLIAKILDKKTLGRFVDTSFEIGLEPVVEINDNKDLKKALKTKTRIIAVNARNLDDLKVDVERACRLLEKVPNQFIKLGFSGISSKNEADKYKKAGAKGILIGTNLMKAGNIKEFLERLK